MLARQASKRQPSFRIPEQPQHCLTETHRIVNRDDEARPFVLHELAVRRDVADDQRQSEESGLEDVERQRLGPCC